MGLKRQKLVFIWPGNSLQRFYAVGLLTVSSSAASNSPAEFVKEIALLIFTVTSWKR